MAKCPKCEHDSFDCESYSFDESITLMAVCCENCGTVVSFIDPYVVSVKVTQLHKELLMIARHLKVPLE